MVDKDSRHSVPLFGEPTFHLGDEPWSRGLQLVDADALSRLCGRSKLATLISKSWLGAPGSPCGSSIQATGASWNLAFCQLLGEQALSCHGLHLGCRHVIQLVMPTKKFCSWVVPDRCVFFVLNDGRGVGAFSSVEIKRDRCVWRMVPINALIFGIWCFGRLNLFKSLRRRRPG